MPDIFTVILIKQKKKCVQRITTDSKQNEKTDRNLVISS